MSEYHSYKELYLIMAKETDRAIQILIAAQQKCEELYLSGIEPDIKLLDFRDK